MASAQGAGEKLVLFLSLVPYVMDRGEVSVDEAAKQFQRDPEDIRKAVELIACAGIPGDSAAYLHTDLFDIDWDLFESEDIIRFENTIVIDQQPRLSNREISALIAGLHYIAAHPAYGERDDVRELLAKLQGHHPDPAGGALLVTALAEDETVKSLSAAIESKRQVQFDYVNRVGEMERRRVDPIALEARDDTWYLRGWCHTRQALRVFRLDRMSNLELSTARADDHPDVGSVESWSIFEPSDSDFTATIYFEKHALPLVAPYLDRSVPPQQEGGGFVADIPFAHEASLIHFVSQHSGLVRVLAPSSAKEAVARFASHALSRLSAQA